MLFPAPGHIFQEMIGQQGDVFAALAQAGHANGNDVQAIVEVLAEGALGDLAVEIAVGGGDDSNIQGISLVPPTGRTVRSCRTRSSLTCMGMVISPISSRKIVP